MAAVKKVIEIEIDVDTGGIKEAEKSVESVAKNTEKAKKGVGGLSAGFQKVGTAMKAAGIGIVVALLAKLASALNNNQGAADGFNTAMTALSIAFNDLFKFLSDNIGTVTGFFKTIFEDPQAAINNFGIAIKEGLIKRFDQLMESIGLLGQSLLRVFEGDFIGAMDLAKTAAVEAVDVITGEENGLQKITKGFNDVVNSVTKYTKSTYENAAALTEQTKQMQFSELASRRLQLQFQKDAEEQRQIRDDETKSFDERIEANRELGRILVESANAEKAEVQKRLNAIANENTLLGETQERLLAIEALKIEQLDIDERTTGFRSEQLTNENSLLREQGDLIISLAEEKKRSGEAAAAKEAETAKALSDAKIGLTNQVAEAAFAVNDALVASGLITAKKAFQIQKAVAIGQAITSGVLAVQKTLAEPVYPAPFNLIAAAAMGVTTAANVVRIGSSKFDAGGASASKPSQPAITSISASSAPQFNTIGQSGTNQLSESIANQNQNPVKAYVVGSDVTTQQSLDRNTVQQASFP